MEEWKIMKTFEKTGTLFCKGDTIYISNKGRIRLNDEILELGKGLYISNGNVCIVGQPYIGHGSLYRWIYYNFKGPYRIGCNYNIHHIDGNHLNNDIDNLIDVTTKEHGKIHGEQYFELLDTIMNTNKIIEEHQSKKEQYIESTKQWYRERINKFKKEESEKKAWSKQKKSQINRLIRLLRKIRKENELIAAGTHFRAKDGRVMSYKQIENMNNGKKHKDLSYITDEYKNKIRNTVKESIRNGRQIGRCKDQAKEDVRREKISKSMKKIWENRKNNVN